MTEDQKKLFDEMLTMLKRVRDAKAPFSVDPDDPSFEAVDHLVKKVEDHG